MSLDNTIQDAGVAEHMRMLEQLRAQLLDESPHLIAVSDILSEEAELSIERGQMIPLKKSTIERHHVSRPFVYMTGMREALTRTWYERSPVALREIVGTRPRTLLWGTKRWAAHTTYHMQLFGRGTRWMVARLDFLTGESREAIEERVEHAGREWIAQALERAGAPLTWIRAQLGEDVL